MHCPLGYFVGIGCSSSSTIPALVVRRNLIIIIIFIVVVVMVKNCQVMVTSFGSHWYRGGASQSPDHWSSVQGKMGAGG